MRASDGTELNWLLDGLVDRTAGANRAVVLSADGLLLGQSGNMSQPDAEHLSAMAAVFQSLAKGTGRHFGGGEVRQTVVEMDHAYLLVTAAGAGACIAMLAGEEADLGMLAYETNLLVSQVGAALSAAPRGAGLS
ncbi:MAG TPA: roadblock/LC7 domain-containing protein [Micromonosporaceae bacterium]|nr:roadblock/LC7 domain-containing protein [Micromonosporaceae bacterium]